MTENKQDQSPKGAKEEASASSKEPRVKGATVQTDATFTPRAEKSKKSTTKQTVHSTNDGSPKAMPLPVAPGTIDFDPPLISCLSILFGLRGKPTSTEALKSGLPHDANPISPAACLRAADNAGMVAKTVHRPKIKKISKLVLPCILVLENSNACVLVGVHGDDAEIITPEADDSVTTATVEDLEANYTGYAIFANLKGRLDDRASDLHLTDTREWFWGNILRFWPIYRHVILATVVVNVLAIASPLFTMNVYDRVVPNNAIDTLWVLAVGVGIAFFFDFLLRNLRGYFVDSAGKNADVIIASRLMQQLMGIKLDHKPQSTGSLANNLREFESLREFFSSTTLLALVDLPFIFIFIALIYYIGGPVATIPIIAVPIVIIVGILIQYPFQKVVESSFKEATQKNAMLVEIISGLEAIKTSLADGQMQKRWEKVVGMSAKSSSRTRALSTFSVSFSQFSSQLVTVGIVIWGVHQISKGEMTMGGLIACTILSGRAMAPLGSVAAMLTRLQQSRMAMKSLDLLMQIPTERRPDQDYIRQNKLQSSITLSDVSFQYPEAESMSINNVSFKITAGEKVGIIGRVGSGKTTLGRLMLGLYEPQKGAVKIGGIDIRQLDIADLRRKIGYVSQDGYLFYGTVRDNISLGMPYADDRTILHAAGVAGVAEFVRTHPAGFGMPVGERGQALSGGQRQSVAIARTLIQNPDILVLDEPTNSMDNGTEALFRQRIANEIKDKTVVLITHRSSMLALVNRLIVIDNGHIVADGPRDKVLVALKNDQVHSVQPQQN